MFKKMGWKWCHGGIFCSFLSCEERKEIRKKKWIQKGYEGQRNVKGEIYSVCFVYESMGNKLNCQ